MVQALRAEIGTSQGTVKRVAQQLGYGVESVRGWVKQAEIDSGQAPGVTTAEQVRIKQLEQELREVKRANAILRSAATFFAAERGWSSNTSRKRPSATGCLPEGPRDAWIGAALPDGTAV